MGHHRQRVARVRTLVRGESALAYRGVPRWVVGVASVGALFVLLPLLAMVLRVNWANFVALVTSEASVAALLLSLRTSVAATVL